MCEEKKEEKIKLEVSGQVFEIGENGIPSKRGASKGELIEKIDKAVDTGVFEKPQQKEDVQEPD